MSCGRLPCRTAASIGAVLVLTGTLLASAAVRRASAHPELDRTEACIRAALRKEKLAITYIREGEVSKATIADKVIEPATTDIFTCAAPALKAAEAADEIGEGDAKAVDSDLTNAAAADDDARHFLADRNGKEAIESLEEADSLQEAALSFVEHAAARQPKPSISDLCGVPAEEARDEVHDPCGLDHGRAHVPLDADARADRSGRLEPGGLPVEQCRRTGSARIRAAATGATTRRWAHAVTREP